MQIDAAVHSVAGIVCDEICDGYGMGMGMCTGNLGIGMVLFHRVAISSPTSQIPRRDNSVPNTRRIAYYYMHSSLTLCTSRIQHTAYICAHTDISRSELA